MRKEPAMGELKKRGKVWWIRYYKNGRRHEESSGSTKEGDAKSLLRLREGDIERGVAVTPKVGRIRFDEAAKDVINDYRTNRKRSIDDVERRIEMHLKPFFGNRRMASITTADVRVTPHSRAVTVSAGASRCCAPSRTRRRRSACASSCCARTPSTTRQLPRPLPSGRTQVLDVLPREGVRDPAGEQSWRQPPSAQSSPRPQCRSESNRGC